MDAVFLPADVEHGCRAIIAEHHRRDELASFGLAPRHKVLLHGAPGNGKTMLAEALAKELDIPLLRVKYAGLIASYLGDTGKNIATIFEFAETAPCLLFLDEFDGIGAARHDNQDVGEMRRITNQLLILLDRLPPYCVFVAATNGYDLIDYALKRRFDFNIEILAPDEPLRRRCALAEIDPRLTPGHDITDLARSIAALPLKNVHEVVQLCRRLRRDLVLNDGRGLELLLREAAA